MLSLSTSAGNPALVLSLLNLNKGSHWSQVSEVDEFLCPRARFPLIYRSTFVFDSTRSPELRHGSSRHPAG